MDSASDDTDSSSDEGSSSPTPPIETGSKACWCKDCVGMVVIPAWETYVHIENVGLHVADLPGTSSSRRV